jgi:hypothetical protein
MAYDPWDAFPETDSLNEPVSQPQNGHEPAQAGTASDAAALRDRAHALAPDARPSREQHGAQAHRVIRLTRHLGTARSEWGAVAIAVISVTMSTQGWRLAALAAAAAAALIATRVRFAAPTALLMLFAVAAIALASPTGRRALPARRPLAAQTPNHHSERHPGGARLLRDRGGVAAPGSR